MNPPIGKEDLLKTLGEFIAGVGVGLLALGVIGALTLAAMFAGVFSTGRFTGAALSLVIHGHDLTAIGAERAEFTGRGLRVQVVCRGSCDNLRIDGSRAPLKVRAFDADGRRVLASGDVAWAWAAGRVRLLKVQPSRRGPKS